MPRPSCLVLEFPEEGVSARADLRWDDAPRTCEAMVALLPTKGHAHQAIYSGSETVLLLDRMLTLPAENATWDVKRGDVGFTWMQAGSSYGVTSDFCEICWFYDHDAQPRMWEGPVKVNLFAKIQEPAEDFYAMCRRIRREGIKAMRVTSE